MLFSSTIKSKKCHDRSHKFNIRIRFSSICGCFVCGVCVMCMSRKIIVLIRSTYIIMWNPHYQFHQWMNFMYINVLVMYVCFFWGEYERKLHRILQKITERNVNILRNTGLSLLSRKTTLEPNSYLSHLFTPPLHFCVCLFLISYLFLFFFCLSVLEKIYLYFLVLTILSLNKVSLVAIIFCFIFLSFLSQCDTVKNRFCLPHFNSIIVILIRFIFFFFLYFSVHFQSEWFFWLNLVFVVFCLCKFGNHTTVTVSGRCAGCVYASFVFVCMGMLWMCECKLRRIKQCLYYKCH